MTVGNASTGSATTDAASTLEAQLREREGDKYGGSPEGISSHYNLSNEFFEIALGETMAYSSALFDHPDENLTVAQERKLDWHLKSAAVPEGNSVLDVGCGWGSILKRASELHGTERCVGITLSQQQVDYIDALEIPNVSCKLENWSVHEPAEPYDSIISIGALEHFAKQEETVEEKIAVYRDFFSRCRSWLTPNGRLSLQTMAFGNMKREDASEFMNEEIFPDSDLPFLGELVAAAEGIFEIVAVRNDRLDYARTYDRWASNLRRDRKRAVALVGEEQVRKMERYFKLISIGFRMGKEHLLRIALRPVTESWAVSASELSRQRTLWPA